MARKYVKNWYTLPAVYLGIQRSNIAKFRNGQDIFLSKKSFQDFRETLFQLHLKDNGFEYSQLDDSILVTTKSGIKMALLQGYSNVIDEIYLQKEYGEPHLHGRTAIDVGASIADTSLYFASLGADMVHAFEIDPVRLGLARNNIIINNMSSTIKLYDREATSSAISKIIESNSLDKVFIKIDCEGCEYEIIENLPADIYKRIQEVTLEYHSGTRRLLQKLKAMDFKVRVNKRPFIKEGIIYALRKSEN